jgi:hypothetical protein
LAAPCDVTTGEPSTLDLARGKCIELNLQDGGVMGFRRPGVVGWIRAGWPYLILLLIIVVLSWITATLIASRGAV